MVNGLCNDCFCSNRNQIWTLSIYELIIMPKMCKMCSNVLNISPRFAQRELVSIAEGNDVLPDGTRPLPKLVSRYLILGFRVHHYGDVIMGTIASEITSLVSVYSTTQLGADQRKHQSSASLAFVRGIHRRPVNSPHNGPVTRKMFPFDDVIMCSVHVRGCTVTHLTIQRSSDIVSKCYEVPLAFR